MNRRAKLRSALEHKAGPVPVDFGSTAVTGMHVTCVAALREHYGLERRPVKVCEPYQMLGLIEPDLREALGVDTVGIIPRKTLFGFANEGWKPFRAPWGQELLVPRDFNVTRRANDLYIHPEGDLSAPPSGHMPDGGFFFDTIVRQEPLDEERLDPRDNLEEFGPIGEEDLAHFQAEAHKAAATGCGVVATFGGTAFGDIALVPAPFLKRPRGIRDIAEWYISTATRKDYVRAIFDRQLEVALRNLARIRQVVGDAVDVVFVCGTDFGTQTSSFCSPATFDALWLPYYRQVNDWIHQHTTWRTFKHSCGAVEPFLSHFVEAGFDIVNPVQCSAAGMDPRTLKQRHGARLVFWGGGVDTQRTLPFGTPEQVRREALERCEIFSAGGGFVFDAIHNVQARTPVANIVAMLDAVREFNGSGNG
jgi:hypothetical protein